MQLNYSFQNSRIKKVFPSVVYETQKNRDAKKKQFSKDRFNYLRCMVINSNVSNYLLVSLFVSKESISSIFNNTVETLQRTPSGPLQRCARYIEILLKLALLLEIPAPKCIGAVYTYSPVGLLLLELVKSADHFESGFIVSLSATFLPGT